jgi:DNA-binding transcriptional ArsR family regulator
LHDRRVKDDAVFRALADPGRRQLLDRLHARNGQTLGELCEGQAVTRQAITKQLSVLEEADLVVVAWRGRQKLHYLNPVPIHQIGARWIGKYERRKLSALEELERGLEESTDEEARLRLRQLRRRHA